MTPMACIEREAQMAATPASTPRNWKAVGKTGAIVRRFEFPDYAETSAFLDRVNELSEETGLYPDLGFSKTYVNANIPDEAGQIDFAQRINSFFEDQPK
jgi:pterin-4a-carbinolamine dehydratase